MRPEAFYYEIAANVRNRDYHLIVINAYVKMREKYG